MHAQAEPAATSAKAPVPWLSADTAGFGGDIAVGSERGPLSAKAHALSEPPALKGGLFGCSLLPHTFVS